MDALMAYQTGMGRMGRMNPAPWDRIGQRQEAPPVGRELDRERYPENVPLDPGRPAGSWGIPADEGERELQIADAIETVYRTYPTLREYDVRVRDERDRGDMGGQLEFLGMNEPGEEGSPRPEADRDTEGAYAGKWHPTIELYKEVVDQDLPKSIFGDQLHHLADPDEMRGVAPQFRSLVEDFEKSLTEEQQAENQWVYDRHEATRENPRSYENWWKWSGRDALVRGYLAPDARDELRRQDFYTDEQIGILEGIRSLLMGSE